MIREVLLWMGVVFVSVLVHEMGHALVSLAYGYHPTIELIWLGGVTRPNAPGPIPWKKNVILTLAGPLAGASLGLGSFLLRQYLSVPPLVSETLAVMAVANFVWAGANLLPVPPLDGGQVTLTIFRRLWGATGEWVALGLGGVCGLVLGLFFSRINQLTAAVLFGMLGFQALVAASARRKVASSGTSPIARLLAEAEALLQRGRLDEAEALAEQLSGEEGGPLLRAQAQRLIGWIALKRGQGRRALDHFSQVQRVRVEPHALAAAFSLIGDEERALPLWELAYREMGNRTILHEWAGALIRAGRTGEALALRDVDPATAFGCAERVAFLRKDYLRAAELGEEALRRAPTPGAAYDAACAYARADRTDDALRLLQRAIALGFKDADFASTDPDLAALRTQAAWPEVLQNLRQSAAR